MRNKIFRNQQQSITLLGEGITEQYYFSHLRAILGYHYTIKPYYFSVTSLTEMDRKITEAISEGGYAIAVFDADVASRNEAERNKMQKIKTKYSKKSNVIICDSLTSIEYWFLLHFENTNRFFNDSAATEAELKKHIPDYEKKKKFLQNAKWVANLCADDKYSLAAQRAAEFGTDGDSYSNIYKAFELFERFK